MLYPIVLLQHLASVICYVIDPLDGLSIEIANNDHSFSVSELCFSPEASQHRGRINLPYCFAPSRPCFLCSSRILIEYFFELLLKAEPRFTICLSHQFPQKLPIDRKFNIKVGTVNPLAYVEFKGRVPYMETNI